MHATEPIDFATLHDLAVIACDADPEARPVAMDPNDARDQAMRVAAILAQLGLPSRVDLSPIRQRVRLTVARLPHDASVDLSAVLWACGFRVNQGLQTYAFPRYPEV